jgi:myo-inositol-1(or 4)-monophosphatase
VINLDEALAFAVDLAKTSGELARSHYRPDLAIDPKDDNSPVTQVDIAINTLVIQRCRAKYPDIGVMGEEESSDGTSDLLWVCDPIDGTIPYALGFHASTFCLALVQEGQPVVAVVYDFMNDRLFSARTGGPALLNGKPIEQSSDPMKLVELERFWSAPHDIGTLHEDLLADKWQVVNLASYGCASSFVLMGRTAGAIYTGDKPWDVAAIALIASLTGCTVTDLDGRAQRYDQPVKGALIAHPKYAQELLGQLVEARSKA